jgi:NAD(P)H-flavin reductase
VNGFPLQVYATSTAIARELSYPQLYLPGRLSNFTPPPLGRILIIVCYWAVILYMMTSGSIVNDVYYWERIGFRNAWVSVTQVPLVYLLASKSNIIGFIVGGSHERLNWLHRWVSRTLLLTVTCHGFFFVAEWVQADFVMLELELMPMVKYGLGAWAVLTWTFFTSLGPLRRVAYEFFVLQHILSGAVFLWLLYVHVPSYAQYNIWFATAALSFDRVARTTMLAYWNLRLKPQVQCYSSQRIGHRVELQAMGTDVTVVTVKDFHIPWKPGQHLYLWVPSIGPLESHPYTIASRWKTLGQSGCNEIQFAIRTHSGFSKRINQYATKTQGPLTGFIAGPYASLPAWEAYESLVLISAATGESFTLPILESILSSQSTICTQRICFLLAAKTKSTISFYIDRLSACISRAEVLAIELSIEITITGETAALHGNADDEKLLEISEYEKMNVAEDAVSMNSKRHSTSERSLGYDTVGRKHSLDTSERNPSLQPKRQILYSYSRPDIKAFIRRPVELTGGETSVAICGGKSIVAAARNAVASLCDERAVHKGPEAQGIYLHVEEYCF